MTSDLLELLSSTPPLYVNAEELTEQDHIYLQGWKPKALLTLRDLTSLLARRGVGDLSLEDVASVVAHAVPFVGDEFWTSEDLSKTAKELLGHLPGPTLDMVTCILCNHIRPLFLDTPHPKVSVSSGRRVPETAKGPGPVLNSYETDRQTWKMRPGTAKLLLWCIENLRIEDYQGVWHLIIPPTMSLLDDHQTYFRLQGVEVASKLIQHVPTGQLKRTGVDGLLISSLRHNTVHLHTPMTPVLLRKSVQTLLTVIDSTTSPNSQARFDQLSGLLGDGIIGGIWVFASGEADTIESSLAVLPDVLRELGIGSVRFLKALIPQMVHNLIPLDVQHTSVSLQILSLQALEVIIEICSPRIYRWRGQIIEGLGRCWVSFVEQPNIHLHHTSAELRSVLRRVAATLATACPSVVEDEYKRLLASDENMFRQLLLLESGKA